MQGSTDLDHIQIIKKVSEKLTDSYLDEGTDAFWKSFRQLTQEFMSGFILDKTIGVNCPKRMENAKILIAHTGELFARIHIRPGVSIPIQQWTRIKSKCSVLVSK